MENKGLIKSPQDFAAGIVVALLGIAAYYFASPLPLGKGADLGPGSFPFGISLILIGLGILLMVNAVLNFGEQLDWYFVRSFALIMALAGIGLLLRKMLFPLFPPLARGATLDWSVILAVLSVVGLIFLLVSKANTNPLIASFVNRGPLFIIAAIITFAVLIRPVGLALTAPLMIILAANATKDVIWKNTIVFAFALTAICIFLFRVVLKQAIPIAPWAGF